MLQHSWGFKALDHLNFSSFEKNSTLILLTLSIKQFKMSGNSKVGNSQTYEAGDQRNEPASKAQQEKEDQRFHEGQVHSHKADDPSE